MKTVFRMCIATREHESFERLLIFLDSTTICFLFTQSVWRMTFLAVLAHVFITSTNLKLWRTITHCDCQYLCWRLAFSLPHQGTCASTGEGVLHPQLSLALALAAEIATTGILIAAIGVRVHLSRAARIPCGSCQREKERQSGQKWKARKPEEERNGGRGDERPKKFHNWRDLYLNNLSNDRHHCREDNSSASQCFSLPSPSFQYNL